jgi:hypothetical protein
LGDGPPSFQQGSSCPVVLRCRLRSARISPTRLSLSLAVLPRTFSYPYGIHCCLCRDNPTVLQPDTYNAGRLAYASFRLIPVRSPLLGESQLISFPEGTEMFQFPSFATSRLCIQRGATQTLLCVGFPIRRSAGQRLFTTYRSLSQFYHVLLRLLVPRHPPNALSNLTTKTFASVTLCFQRASKRSGKWPSCLLLLSPAFSGQLAVFFSHCDA